MIHVPDANPAVSQTNPEVRCYYYLSHLLDEEIVARTIRLIRSYKFDSSGWNHFEWMTAEKNVSLSKKFGFARKYLKMGLVLVF